MPLQVTEDEPDYETDLDSLKANNKTVLAVTNVDSFDKEKAEENDEQAERVDS